MAAEEPRPALGGKKLGWQGICLLVLTNIASLAILVWVLRDIKLSEMVDELRNMRWWWVAAAAVSDILVYVVQGWRWSILLEPVAKIPMWQSVRAIYVGLYANEVLPLRTGEIIRTYLMSRWGNLPFSVVLSSVAIERVFDGIWLVLYLAVVMQFVELPKRVRDGGFALILIVGLLAAILAFIVAFQERAKRWVKKWGWGKSAEIFIKDLQEMGESRTFFLSWVASLPHLLAMALPIFCVLKASNFQGFTIWDAMVINVIVRLGTVVPSAPGNLGVYQGLIVLALTFYGIEDGAAKRFSVLVWGIVTLPLLIAGFIALSVTGFKLRELHRTASAAEAEHKI